MQALTKPVVQSNPITGSAIESMSSFVTTDCDCSDTGLKSVPYQYVTNQMDNNYSAVQSGGSSLFACPDGTAVCVSSTLSNCALVICWSVHNTANYSSVLPTKNTLLHFAVVLFILFI